MKWFSCQLRDLSRENYEETYRSLPPEEQERVKGLRHPEDRMRTLAARRLAHQGVCGWCDVEEVTFARTEMGKLYPVGVNAEISVSHSGDLAACVVSCRPVGIDLERLRPVNLGIARKICDPEELRYLFGGAPGEADFSYTEDPELIQRFFRLWTGKEACAKRQGTGIGSLRHQHPLQENLRYERCGDYLICIAGEK